jgi:hypothetical protein
MLKCALEPMEYHQAGPLSLRRWILGDQRGRKNVIEFFNSHMGYLKLAVCPFNSEQRRKGWFVGYSIKLTKINRVQQNLQVKNSAIGLPCLPGAWSLAETFRLCVWSSS